MVKPGRNALRCNARQVKQLVDIQGQRLLLVLKSGVLLLILLPDSVILATIIALFACLVAIVYGMRMIAWQNRYIQSLTEHNKRMREARERGQ